MHPLQLETFAKINLTLGITGRRPDGYHLLATVMQSVSLSDRLTLAIGETPGIQIHCADPAVPADRHNTAWRAADRFCRAAGIEPALTLTIEKRIPAAAGLAGGSSNAAGVLAGLDRLYPGRLSQAQLLAIAAGIGADVPFCLSGGTQLCTGIGDVLEPLPALPERPILLVAAPFGLSTPDMFQAYDRLLETAAPGQCGLPGPLSQPVQPVQPGQASLPGQPGLPVQPDHAAFLPALADGRWGAMARAAANALEAVAFARHPELAAVRGQLAASGALMARMSGSGPTLFAVYADEGVRHTALTALKDRLPAGFSLLPAHLAAAGVRIGPPLL